MQQPRMNCLQAIIEVIETVSIAFSTRFTATQTAKHSGISMPHGQVHKNTSEE